MNDYKSINCSWYDRLEAFAVRKQVVSITYHTETGEPVTLQTVITDVFARDQAEWLKTATGLVLRLDEILTVNNQPLSGECRL